jgi:NADPH2:quinone reductase
MTKTILVAEVGGPDVMKVVDRDPGHPGPGEIRLRQTAMGVNFGDIHKRRGTAPPHAMADIKFPFTPGLEAAGIVEEVGADVSGFHPGDRVAYAVASMLGGYAEARLFQARLAFKLPDAVADADAAALLYKGITVQGMIRQCYVVKPGDVILLHAAAGGVGTVLTRWAKHLGATVIGTVSTDDKVGRAIANGCNHVIVTQREDFAQRALDITGGHGVDVVYDGVGQAVFLKSFDCLRKSGTMVSFGQSSGMVEPFDPVMLQHKGHYLTKFSGSTYNADVADYQRRAAEVLDAIASGVLPVGDHTIYKLGDAVSAHRDFEERRTIGSIVMVP